MSFGAALRLLRINHGTSLRSLATEIGVSSAYLSRVENGHDPTPTPDRLIALARALNLPSHTLVELADRTPPVIAEYLAQTPAAGALFLEVVRRKLTPAQLQRVRAFIEAEFPTVPGPAIPALVSLFSPDRVLLGVQVEELSDALDLAASRFSQVYPDVSSSKIAQALAHREREAATAVGHGIGVPHCGMPVGRPAGVLMTLERPISVGPDGLPLRVLLVLVGVGEGNLPVLARAVLVAQSGLAKALAGVREVGDALGVLGRLEVWGRG